MLVVMTNIFTTAENPCHIAGKDQSGYDIRNVKKSSFSSCKRECSYEPRYHVLLKMNFLIRKKGTLKSYFQYVIILKFSISLNKNSND